MACPHDVLDQGHRLGQAADAPGPDEVAGDDAHDPVAQLVLVHEDAQARGQRVVDVLVAGGRTGRGSPVRSRG